MSDKTALALAAHPDDIEFAMGGTLLLLREAGYRTHYCCLANGYCGSASQSGARTAARRRGEARAGARILGAKFHPSLTNDLEIFYDLPLLRRVAALVREVRPSIVLTHSPQDYMEDHTNTARLAVTAVFSRGMRNFATAPRRNAVPGEATIYHAMPHGLRDGLNRLIVPESYVDIASVFPAKHAALAAHRSQQEWLEQTQGMESIVQSMERMMREMGISSRKFSLAEGWRRHNPLGLCAPDADPLRDALGGKYRRNPRYR